MGFFSLFTKKNDNEELKEALQGGCFLVDVRTAAEFRSGSAQGAINIPVDVLSSQISKFKGKKRIVVFCQSGGRSGSAKSILERNGFTNVINGGSVRRIVLVQND